MPNMLSDEELHAVAVDYVCRTYDSSCTPVPQQTYTVPDGIYFNVGPEALVGDGGFFVSRAGGEVCPFGSGHVVSEGIDYWLRRFAEGWRPGFYYVTLEAEGDWVELSELLWRQGVAVRNRVVSSGSTWTWAQMVCTTEFPAKLQRSMAVLVRAETLDDLRSELSEGRLKGSRFTHLGEFCSVSLSELTSLECVHSDRTIDVATRGGLWVYLPTALERGLANEDSGPMRVGET